MSIFELIFPKSIKRLEIAREIFIALRAGPFNRNKMQELIEQISKKTGRSQTTVQIVLKDLKHAGMVVYTRPNYSISPAFVSRMNESWTEVITGAKQ